MNTTVTVLAMLAAATTAALAQHPAPSDSVFRGVQQRGGRVMGVDQYTSAHTFAPLEDGGSITLVRNEADSAGIAQIRQHMREIAGQFAQGNFTAPFLVHAQQVPGTTVMAQRREHIRFEVMDLPRGAMVRIRTADAAALAAVHEFLAFQRMDHRAHH